MLEYLTVTVLDEFLDSKSPLFQAKFANLKKDIDKKVTKKTGDKGKAKDSDGEASNHDEGGIGKKKKKKSSGKKRAQSSASDGSVSGVPTVASSSAGKKTARKKSRSTRPKKKANTKSAGESGAST